MLISVALGFGIFAVCLLGFYEGLRLGMRAAKGVEPKPIHSPVAVIKEKIQYKKAQKEAEKIADEWELFEQFNGYTDEEMAEMGGEQ